jgi:tripartite-type tricarboxylate transporter receptor subunit TctC
MTHDARTMDARARRDERTRRKRGFVRAATAGLLGVAAMMAAIGPGRVQAAQEPITLVVPWAKGGGTDQLARMLAERLTPKLGQSVKVRNVTTNAGLDGHRLMANAPADGTTLGIMTPEVWIQESRLEPSDFTLIAMFNFDPAALHVRVDSPYKDAGDLLEAVRETPGAIPAGGGPRGSIWHLNLARLFESQNVSSQRISWIPGHGTAVAFRDLVAGTIDLVPASVPEAAKSKAEGRIRTLAVLSNERLDIAPEVPTIREVTGRPWTATEAWRGVVAPAGLPDAQRERFVKAVRQVYEAPAFAREMRARGFGRAWKAGQAFQTHIETFRKEVAKLTHAIGLKD